MLATKPGVLWKGSKSFQLLSPLSSPYAITSVMALLRLSVYVYIHTYVWKSEDDFCGVGSLTFMQVQAIKFRLPALSAHALAHSWLEFFGNWVWNINESWGPQ